VRVPSQSDTISHARESALSKRGCRFAVNVALDLHRVESKAVAQIVTEVPLPLGLALRMPLRLYVSVYFDLGAVLKGKRALDAETEGFLTD
jgi:hypothetical protein